jgi:hypothetical protein
MTKPAWGGTWSLIQTSTAAGLATTAASLSTPKLRGLSVRVPGTALADNSVLDAAAALAATHKVALALRFMAGTSTPVAALGHGVPFAGGGQIPVPFMPDGSPNLIFETWFAAKVDQLAAYNPAELHLSTYGAKWAELYQGPEVTSAKGYSDTAWYTGHYRLLDIAVAHSKGLMLETPLTGIGPLIDGGPADSTIVKHIAATHPGLIAVQSNNKTATSPLGKWPIPHGAQMYGVGDYDWAAVYAGLVATSALSLEIYSPSFAPNLAHHSALLSEILTFA